METTSKGNLIEDLNELSYNNSVGVKYINQSITESPSELSDDTASKPQELNFDKLLTKEGSSHPPIPGNEITDKELETTSEVYLTEDLNDLSNNDSLLVKYNNKSDFNDDTNSKLQELNFDKLFTKEGSSHPTFPRTEITDKELETTTQVYLPEDLNDLLVNDHIGVMHINKSIFELWLEFNDEITDEELETTSQDYLMEELNILSFNNSLLVKYSNKSIAEPQSDFSDDTDFRLQELNFDKLLTKEGSSHPIFPRNEITDEELETTTQVYIMEDLNDLKSQFSDETDSKAQKSNFDNLLPKGHLNPPLFPRMETTYQNNGNVTKSTERIFNATQQTMYQVSPKTKVDTNQSRGNLMMPKVSSLLNKTLDSTKPEANFRSKRQYGLSTAIANLYTVAKISGYCNLLVTSGPGAVLNQITIDATAACTSACCSIALPVSPGLYNCNLDPACILALPQLLYPTIASCTAKSVTDLQVLYTNYCPPITTTTAATTTTTPFIPSGVVYAGAAVVTAGAVAVTALVLTPDLPIVTAQGIPPGNNVVGCPWGGGLPQGKSIITRLALTLVPRGKVPVAVFPPFHSTRDQ